MKALLPLAAACLFSQVNAACSIISTGTSGDIVITGTLLTTLGPRFNGALLVQSGQITYAGPRRYLSLDATRNTTFVECTGSSVISPGFINAHEHIEYSTIMPLADIGERCDHRHDWRRGLRGHTKREAKVNGSAVAATAWGELRHLFSGTTSIVGGAMAPGLARNLDFLAGLEQGIRSAVVTWDVFPLDDSVGILRDGDCDYGVAPINSDVSGKLHRYMAHVAEGVDAEAANEFRCLSDSRFDTIPLPGREAGVSTDIVWPNMALVHALGLSDADFELVASRGASVVWSPRSNVFLYGKTLNVTHLLEAGVNVALGTDWLPSGSATMGREAVCARDVTWHSFSQGLQPKILWEMMTVNAARAVGFDAHIGSLVPGKVADIVVFGGGNLADNKNSQDDVYARAIFAGAEDVELVMRGGKVMVAGANLKGLASEPSCETVSFGRADKHICVADELGSSFAQFQTSLKGVYPAILPGVPDNEPTCKPTR
ncbi:hypothetical protein MAPG_06011 [Magnaporthiopsis poae ATCC 64411]|uniref:Amidohydrolase-related domain-containing protein n=1 Tax=Magnaporthiopsis poae (strain ATCC 64411 / 73-15) TaxID=644358 RepID=A0A0C4E0X1_MAGP6|nr:hypothetical protein MAPG_06011 [Magnaporthiopsis poae ATCC 64411]